MYYNFRISSTEALIEELSEKQEVKLEEFKERGSFKDVTLLLGKIGDTPKRPDPRMVSQTPRGPQPPSSAVKRTPAGDKGVPPASTSKSTTITKPKPDAKVTTAKTEVPSAPASSNHTSTANGANNSTNGAASSSTTSDLDQPQPNRRYSGRVDTPMPPPSSGPPRVLLNPVPQSPYRQLPPEQPIRSEPEPERGWMDSILDFLIGASTTVPKLCQFCGAHNGLIPIEERNHAEFVCHRCRAFNSSRSVSASSAASSAEERLANALRSKMANNPSSSTTSLASTSSETKPTDADSHSWSDSSLSSTTASAPPMVDPLPITSSTESPSETQNPSPSVDSTPTPAPSEADSPSS